MAVKPEITATGSMPISRKEIIDYDNVRKDAAIFISFQAEGRYKSIPDGIFGRNILLQEVLPCHKRDVIILIYFK